MRGVGLAAALGAGALGGLLPALRSVRVPLADALGGPHMEFSIIGCHVALLAGLLSLASCSKSEPTTDGGGGGGSPSTSGPGAALRLAADPASARSVVDLRAQADTNGEVVVYGRVSSIVPGLAVFTLIDTKLDYCGGGPDSTDTCPTPWDYCCIPGEKRAQASLTVEARDAQGKTLADPLADLRLLDLVAAKGKLEKDAQGNHTIVASGWFRRERPKLPEGLEWPTR